MTLGIGSEPLNTHETPHANWRFGDYRMRRRPTSAGLGRSQFFRRDSFNVRRYALATSRLICEWPTGVRCSPLKEVRDGGRGGESSSAVAVRGDRGTRTA